MVTRHIDRAHERLLELVRDGRYEEAIEFSRSAIDSWDSAEVHEAWNNLAYALWASGRKGDARLAISRAIELAPEDRRHRLARAMRDAVEEDFALAKLDWTELVRLEERMNSTAFLGTALLGRAIANLHLGDLAAAQSDLERVESDEAIVLGRRVWTAQEVKNLLADARR
jgi:tetratricopeptide (TPR) repeat protein